MILRRLFMLTCAISLVVCLATIVLWVRSQWLFDTFELAFARPSGWPARVHSVMIESCQSRLRMSTTVYQDDPDNQDADTREKSPRWRWRHSSEHDRTELELDHDQGDGYEREGMHYLYGEFEWTATIVPHLHVVLWAAALPAAGAGLRISGCIAAWRRRRRQASSRPMCAGCGYDVRATPDRCPECGKVLAARP